MIPVEHSSATHVLHRERTVEVFANVTPDVLFKHKGSTWVMEMVLLKVHYEVVNHCHMMSGLHHFHELMVTHFSWWRFKLNFSTPVILEPYFENKNYSSKP